MRFPSDSSTRVPCVLLDLFSQGVSILMCFYVVFVSEMPYTGLMVVGFPLQLLHSLVLFIKYYDNLVLLLLIKLLFILFFVSEPNRRAPAGIPRGMPCVLLRYVSFIMCPSHF